MDVYLASVFAFVGILVLLILKNREKIEVRNYVMFVRRTERGRDLIEKVSSLSKRFWNKVGYVATVIGFGGMGVAFVYLSNILFKQLTGAPTAGGGPRFVLPVPSQEATIMPGIIGVPFWSWIISIGILMVVHEGMHGVMVKTVKSKIQSLGVLLFAVIPGAFVEPNEEDLRQKDWKDQLKVYSAGSFANFCTAAIFFLAINFLFIPAFTTQVAAFQGYMNASQYGKEAFPAERVNLTSAILYVDGKRTKTFGEISKALKGKKPGDVVKMRTPGRNFTITLAENPENRTKPLLGILSTGKGSATNVLKEKYRGSSLEGGLSFVQKLLGWIFALNLGIGLMNLLPLKPLDGGLMVETVAERFCPERREKIVRGTSALSLFLLVSIFFLVFTT